MEDTQLEILILEYLEDETSAERKAEIKQILVQSDYDLNELSALERVSENMSELPLPEPSEKLDENFHKMLKNYKADYFNKPVSILTIISSWFGKVFAPKNLPKFGYGFALIFIGWGIGFWLTPNTNYQDDLETMSTEIKQMKEVIMLSMLKESSPSERIKAVNLSSNLNEVDSRVISALLKTLNNDPNVNVRLVTVEALLEFSDIPEVREGLIQSIGQQNSPLVQLALADVMVALQEKESVKELQILLERKELNDAVRTRVKTSIAKLI